MLRAVVVGMIAALAGCALWSRPSPEALGYGLADVDWSEARAAYVAELRPRYPEYVHQVFDEGEPGELDLRPLRDDLEHAPVDARNYAALNAVAIGYFELNARAEELRASPSAGYLGDSFRVAKLVSVPWRAYREIESGALRDAILDFFDDAASDSKPAAARTASRLAAIVASLEERETDPARRERIREIAGRLAGDPF